jgi:glycosidase
MPWAATPGGGFTTGRPWHAFAPGKERANVAAQTGDPASLLSHYRKLIRARRASPALGRGALRLLESGGSLLAFLRSEGAERVLVVHNLGDQALGASLGVAASEAVPLFASEGLSLEIASGQARLFLPPHASGVYRLR